MERQDAVRNADSNFVSRHQRRALQCGNPFRAGQEAKGPFSHLFEVRIYNH